MKFNKSYTVYKRISPNCSILTVLSFLKSIYLKGRTNTEKEKGRDWSFSSVAALPKCPQELGLCQIQVRNPELPPGLWHGWAHVLGLLAGSWIRRKQLGLTLAPPWNSGFPGSSLVRDATKPALRFFRGCLSLHQMVGRQWSSTLWIPGERTWITISKCLMSVKFDPLSSGRDGITTPLSYNSRSILL